MQKDERQVMHIRLDKSKHEWVTEQAKQQGISKNDVIQMSINKAMQEEQEKAVNN